MSHERSKMGLFLAVCLAALPTLLLGNPLRACTIAVVSGKATEDGRPLLWKNRDMNSPHNQVRIFTDGKYRVMGVIDAGRTDNIWMGMNEAGFCLINSVSMDLPGGNKAGQGNGRFMKLALQTCGSVAEFEALLSETNSKGRRTRANFGVVDAHGDAMIFETGHRSFTKFDANDPETAPRGYVVRSNFSMSVTGAKHQYQPQELLKVYSGNRYLRAEELVGNRLAQNGHLNFRFFLQDICRDLSNTIDGPLTPLLFRAESDDPLAAATKENRRLLSEKIDTQSTINRRTTVSVAVFHGVKPGDAPQWTTMWTVLGEPAFSVAVPCWMTANQPSAILCGKQRSPLCSVAREVRELNYDSPKVLNTRWLRQIWSQTLPVENQIIQQTAERMKAWQKRKKLPLPEEITGFQETLAESAMQSLLEVHTLIFNQPALAEKPNRELLANQTTELQGAASLGD